MTQLPQGPAPRTSRPGGIPLIRRNKPASSTPGMGKLDHFFTDHIAPHVHMLALVAVVVLLLMLKETFGTAFTASSVIAAKAAINMQALTATPIVVTSAVSGAAVAAERCAFAGDIVSLHALAAAPALVHGAPDAVLDNSREPGRAPHTVVVEAPAGRHANGAPFTPAIKHLLTSTSTSTGRCIGDTITATFPAAANLVPVPEDTPEAAPSPLTLTVTILDVTKAAGAGADAGDRAWYTAALEWARNANPLVFLAIFVAVRVANSMRKRSKNAKIAALRKANAAAAATPAPAAEAKGKGKGKAE